MRGRSDPGTIRICVLSRGGERDRDLDRFWGSLWFGVQQYQQEQPDRQAKKKNDSRRDDYSPMAEQFILHVSLEMRTTAYSPDAPH